MKKAPAKMKKKSMAKMAKKSPAKMMKKSPAKKPLVGKQANLPKELRDKILASPAKMLKPAALKMMKKSPTKMVGTIGRAIKTGVKKISKKIKAAEKKKMDKQLERGARRVYR